MADASQIDWSKVSYQDLIKLFPALQAAQGGGDGGDSKSYYQTPTANYNGLAIQPMQWDAANQNLQNMQGLRINSNGNMQSGAASTNGVANDHTLYLGQGADGMTTSRMEGNSGGWLTPSHLAALAASAIGAGYAFGGIGGAAGGGTGLGGAGGYGGAAGDFGLGGAAGSGGGGVGLGGYGGSLGAAGDFGGVAGSAGASGGGYAGAAAGAGGYSIPTAAELSAGGFGTGGMGMTGAGGIGSASSVVGAGAGAAGYGGAGAAAAGGGVMSQIAGLAGNPLVKAGVGLAGGLLGGISGANAPKNLTATQTSQIDPRMGNILYGADGQSGLMNQLSAQANKPQSAGTAAFGNGMDAYLGQYGRGQFDTNMRAAQGMTGSNIQAPTMTGAQSAMSPLGAKMFQGNTPGDMQAAQINAPGQNNLGLASSFNDMIYGSPGANPYLSAGIQGGINQSTAAFQNMQTDATRNLTENILPNIRSGAIASGQMGSSRQAITESKALNDFSTQSARAATLVEQQNANAAAQAHLQAYGMDRSNQLAAMSNLNSNQYGTATNNAQLQQQAGMNNYGGQLTMNQANLGAANQNSMFNAGMDTQNNQFNATSANQASAYNGQWQNATNALNSNNQQYGIDASNTMLKNANTYGNQQNNYDLSRLSTVADSLHPFTGLNNTDTKSQPLYQNTAGNVLGGVTAGLGLLSAAQKYI